MLILSSTALAWTLVEVTDVQGAPVAGVQFERPDSRFHEVFDTDQRGEVLLPAVPAVQFADKRYIVIREDDTPEFLGSEYAYDPTIADLARAYRVAPACDVSLRVVDGGGAPVPLADVDYGYGYADTHTDDQGLAVLHAYAGLVRLDVSVGNRSAVVETPLVCDATTTVTAVLKDEPPLPADPAPPSGPFRTVRLADACFGRLADDLHSRWDDGTSDPVYAWTGRTRSTCTVRGRYPGDWTCRIPTTATDLFLDDPAHGCVTPARPPRTFVSIPVVDVPAGVHKLEADDCPSGGELHARWTGALPAAGVLWAKRAGGPSLDSWAGDGSFAPLDAAEDGTFNLRWVPAGDYLLVVRRLGEVSGTAAVTVPEGRSATVEVRPDTGKATGRLPAGVDPRFVRIDARPAGVVRWDDDGAVRVSGLPPSEIAPVTLTLTTAGGVWTAQVCDGCEIAWTPSVTPI